MQSAPMEAYGPSRRPPRLMRWLGARWNDGDGTFRTKLGEISIGRRQWGQLAFELGAHETPHLHIALLVFSWFIPLPLFTQRWFPGDCGIDRARYGFSWRFGKEWGGDLHLSWGRRSKITWAPWGLEHIRTDYLGDDLEWHDDRLKPASWRRLAEEDAGPEPWTASYPFHYMLDNGEVQHTIATVTRRRAFHGRRWIGPKRFRAWLRSILPVTRFESLDIAFDDEMGERRGSWKGGTVGTSCKIGPDESPIAALRRYQRTARFR